MKTVYLIGGTMGIGKTSTSRLLKMRLQNSVFLDGDWCWDANPFCITPETKRMVIENICFLLNNFIRCSAYEHIIFCWVMHEQPIIDDILLRLALDGCRVKTISLVCGEEALRTRSMQDVAAGLRTVDDVARSVARIPLYDRLDTCKIDVSEMGLEEVADAVLAI